MPKPLSQDLRIRIMAAYEAGGVTQQQVADRFEVGVASVVRLTWLKREQGHLRPGVGGPGSTARSIDAVGEELLRSMLKEEPDLTREELVDRLHERSTCQTSASSVGRTLERMGFTRKKDVDHDEARQRADSEAA